ncbi:hypothetical protein [Cytobacillus purgationiresistens]|uniref:Uncharacterized protein n=1 Tax=Cytobacillus purgationiresistens TaxID=863449 RepID=A0ABU0AID7_9BACI|nr:hypothetical protein [Cytobacillus purgationiresistens]MDQ0270471.1 hypothetical protein [Cytobacillus purgationiresistens]
MTKKRIIGLIFIFSSIALLCSLTLFVFFGGEKSLPSIIGKKDGPVGKEETVSAEQGAYDEIQDDIGSFIAVNHEFYNETLGWGRENNIKWHKQKEQAERIQANLKALSTDNSDLQEDFTAIDQMAESIIDGTEDKKTALMLHRYFHDLDVVFNEYKDTKDFYNLIEFKGE